MLVALVKTSCRRTADMRQRRGGAQAAVQVLVLLSSVASPPLAVYETAVPCWDGPTNPHHTKLTAEAQIE
jgi:hypothetical protein